MKLLAIETSSTACSVALSIDNQIQSIFEIAPMQQAQLILPMVDRLLTEARVSFSQLDAIAFGCGPGSFTGVRIATSVAQGLGFALNLPLIPISSLAALAQMAYKKLGWKKLLVVIDARIQEVYWGAYQVNANGLVELVGNEQVCAPQEIKFPADSMWYGVGNAWHVYGNELVYAAKDKNSTFLPAAEGVIGLAQEKFLLNQYLNPKEVRPSYLRNNVAKKMGNQSN